MAMLWLAVSKFRAGWISSGEQVDIALRIQMVLLV